MYAGTALAAAQRVNAECSSRTETRRPLQDSIRRHLSLCLERSAFTPVATTGNGTAASCTQAWEHSRIRSRFLARHRQLSFQTTIRSTSQLSRTSARTLACFGSVRSRPGPDLSSTPDATSASNLASKRRQTACAALLQFVAIRRMQESRHRASTLTMHEWSLTMACPRHSLSIAVCDRWLSSPRHRRPAGIHNGGLAALEPPQP